MVALGRRGFHKGGEEESREALYFCDLKADSKESVF